MTDPANAQEFLRKCGFLKAAAMSMNKTASCPVKLVYKKNSYESRLYCVPGVGAFVELHVKNQTEPVLLKVKKVICNYDHDSSKIM